MLKVKICGLTCQEDITSVNAYRPDYAGFVFAESKRRVTPAEAASFIHNLHTCIQAVGVFVNMEMHQVAEITHRCGLAAVQLHGHEDQAYMYALRRLLPARTLVIKAIRVRNQAVLEAALQINCDLLLLDAYREGMAGGTGETCDWRLLQNFRRPYILAGGLNGGNLQTALGMLRPYGVDVSSGVETGGRKDPEKIRDFIQTARRYSHGDH